MVTGLVAVVAVLPSCSTTRSKRASPTAATTVATATSSSSSSSSTTIAVVSTTGSTSRPPTTLPASSPEGSAAALYAAWTNGDRAAAERVAQPQAAAALFARRWQAGDGWTFAECSGAAGSIICAWQRPSGEQLLVRVQNTTGGSPATVSDVRFQP